MIHHWQQQLSQHIIARYRQQRLPHALLFAGGPGIGKKVFAHGLANFLLCEKKTDVACGHCHSCELFQAGNHPDFILLEPEESKMIKVDEVRSIGTFVNTSSQYHQAKVVIIHHADRMNVAASNALLKTLEEPAKHVYLILLVEQPSFLPATIRSRCQLYRIAAQTECDEIEAKERHAFFHDCCELLRKRTTLVELSEKWQKINLHTLLQHASSWAIDLLKLKLTPEATLINESDRATLEKLSNVCSLDALFDYADKLLASKKIIATQVAVNSQMMLEDVLLVWRGVLS